MFLLAEVTLKIKKTWHMKRQLKSVKFGGYSSFFSCLLYSTLTVVSLFESRSAQLEDENVKWSFF